jgi:hypothetical protein
MLRPLPSEPFELSQQDRATSLWLRLSAHLEDRQAACRVKNDRDMPEEETAALRGEIKTLKGLIALGAERPVID